MGKFLEGSENSEKWEGTYGPVYRIWSGMRPEVQVNISFIKPGLEHRSNLDATSTAEFSLGPSISKLSLQTRTSTLKPPITTRATL